MSIRTIIVTASLSSLALTIGCDHKAKPAAKDQDPQAAANRGGSAQAPNGTPTPTPPATPTPTPSPGTPTPTPPADLNTVRPPTAADLATYTQGLPGTGPLMARIETTKGVINCELFGDKAPMTVANFVGLATGKKAYIRGGQTVVGKPYFDGLTFHRAVPGFMIQGGDPDGRGSGGPGYQFAQEINPAIKHVPGVLSMANAGPNTNGSQFFIMDGVADFLDGGYNAFGQCKDLEVVKSITGLPRRGELLVEPVVMTKVTISRGA